MPSFKFEGQRIAYTEYGGGPAAVTAAGERGRTAKSAAASSRPVILLHGLPRSRLLRAPARHVALLDGLLRSAGRRADGPPADRAGRRDGHFAGRQRGDRGSRGARV